MKRKLTNSPHIAVLGGGVAGCTAAIKLAEAGIYVTLFDKDDLLCGSSDRTPGRMGIGFHYLSQEATSQRYLRSTINFIKKYPNFILSAEKDNADYLKKGWYFICKNGFLSKENALFATKKLNDAYANLIKENKNNSVFGEPKYFYRILPFLEYEPWINTDLVELGIETRESLLDWPKFKTHLLNRINQLELIKQRTNTEVSYVIYNKHLQKYQVCAQGNISPEVVEPSYDFIINSSWENIEEINLRSNISNSCFQETKRLKLLVEVQLPDDLYCAHSMFFCLGPHCMFSNMGNGIGKITFAPITNHKLSSDLILPNEIKEILNDPNVLEKPMYLDLGNKIIQNVAKYIPLMKNASLIKIHAGIVKSRGEVDIYNSQSSFHQRDYSGVIIKNSTWIDNASIKLFYCEDNANKILKIITEYFFSELD